MRLAGAPGRWWPATPPRPPTPAPRTRTGTSLARIGFDGARWRRCPQLAPGAGRGARVRRGLLRRSPHRLAAGAPAMRKAGPAGRRAAAVRRIPELVVRDQRPNQSALVVRQWVDGFDEAGLVRGGGRYCPAEGQERPPRIAPVVVARLCIDGICHSTEVLRKGPHRRGARRSWPRTAYTIHALATPHHPKSTVIRSTPDR